MATKTGDIRIGSKVDHIQNQALRNIHVAMVPCVMPGHGKHEWGKGCPKCKAAAALSRSQ